jgi:hypothetical protein
LGLHDHGGNGDRLAQGLGLGGDIDHVGLALGIEVSQGCCRYRIFSHWGLNRAKEYASIKSLHKGV